METHEQVTIRVARPTITVLEGDLISRQDLAALVGKSPGTVANWFSKRIGPKPKKIGNKNFYDYGDAKKRMTNGTMLEPWGGAA